MPSIDTDKLIREYWESVKEKYPNFTFEHFERVCKAPFYFFKSKMATKETPVIHIKYIGKFRIYPNYVKTLMARNDYRKRKGTITDEVYEQRNNDYQLKFKQAIEYENSWGNKKDGERGEEVD